jgi:hypothetical protein
MSPFLLCLNSEGYPASLEVRKIYRTVPDSVAAARGFVRIVDESGDDYLYPTEWFVEVEVPEAALGIFAEAT